MQILLTGSSGFVGSRILEISKNQDQINTISLQSVAPTQVDFKGIESIIHCAGIAHRMEPTPDELYFQVNRDLTLDFAKAAKAAGVRQFIFLSTIKVYGLDFSTSPISLTTPCHPNDAYGSSKYEAEQELLKLEDDSFTVAIIRPPLIYGPGAKGNLLKLMQFSSRNKPIPLGGIQNERSMVFVDNLIAITDHIIEHKASGTYLPSDSPTLSTSELMQEILQHINPSKKLLPIPKIGQKLIGIFKPAIAQRLFKSLVVDSTESYDKIDFTPPYSSKDGIRLMCEHYLKSK
ncbi:MAG: hypothetical protein CMP48_15695 [Rickettsiales bacterium]|nr:hypothetical protein [Rickettsiales bacterium]